MTSPDAGTLGQPFTTMGNKIAVKAKFGHRRMINDAILGLDSRAMILDITSGHDVNEYILIVALPSNPTPFVTFLCEARGEEAALFWGHYFDSLGTAWADFQRRTR